MMHYSAQSDIEKELEGAQLVQLTDDNEDGVVDGAVVARAIADADAEIDAHLASRYTVPLATVPDLVRNLSVTIAIHKLFTRRNLMNEARASAYKAAVALLDAIAAGKASVGVAPSVAPEQGGPKGSRVEDDRLFTIGRTGTLENF